jgi:hypothetical protein
MCSFLVTKCPTGWSESQPQNDIWGGKLHKEDQANNKEDALRATTRQCQNLEARYENNVKKIMTK